MQVRRTKRKRRWGSYPEFPLRDSSGVVVFSDRRRHISDRRLDDTSLEDRLLMFSEMPPPDRGNANNP